MKKKRIEKKKKSMYFKDGFFSNSEVGTARKSEEWKTETCVKSGRKEFKLR